MFLTDFLKIFTLDSVLNKQLLEVLLWNMLLEGFLSLMRIHLVSSLILNILRSS